jgi:hypothetical protein
LATDFRGSTRIKLDKQISDCLCLLAEIALKSNSAEGADRIHA